MKYLFVIYILSVMLVSCKKEIPEQSDPLRSFNAIKLQLQDSLSPLDFKQLDFSNAVLDRMKNEGISFLRIPFFNKSIQTDFILLTIEKEGSFSAGKIYNIIKDKKDLSGKVFTKFNGRITIHSLKRTLLTSSLITNGYVEAFHQKDNLAQAKEAIVIVPLMPEVIVICTIPKANNWEYWDYYNLQGLFSGNGTGYNNGGEGIAGAGNQSNGNYYSNSNTVSAGGNPVPNAGSGAGMPTENEPALIDFEFGEELPAININQYIKCFASIPDAGATCSIKIMTDIPVDKEPAKFFDWATGSPGHTFLQLTKTNDGQMVQQNIGFYPVTGWKNIFTTAPTESKLVDNSGHEFNASLSMDLTPDKFQSTLTHIQYLSNFIKYDIDEYNCTDFALEVFNYRRGGDQLTIPKYDIPGGTAQNGTATPQGVFLKLNALKEAGGADASKISLPVSKAYVGKSNGPCN